MKLIIDVSSNEAEMILFALALRSKQSKLSPQMASEAVDLSKRLNTCFEQSFGWDSFDRTAHYRKPLKRVSLTCYDYAPRD